MTDRELMQMALDALIDAADSQSWELQQNIDQHGDWYRRSVYLKQAVAKSQEAIIALRAALAQPEQEMADEDWHEIWEQFDWDHPDIEEEFQKEMVAKHGEAHYYMDADESWKRQKKLIQKLVEAKLKEKNT